MEKLPKQYRDSENTRLFIERVHDYMDITNKHPLEVSFELELDLSLMIQMLDGDRPVRERHIQRIDILLGEARDEFHEKARLLDKDEAGLSGLLAAIAGDDEDEPEYPRLSTLYNEEEGYNVDDGEEDEVDEKFYVTRKKYNELRRRYNHLLERYFVAMEKMLRNMQI